MSVPPTVSIRSRSWKTARSEGGGAGRGRKKTGGLVRGHTPTGTVRGTRGHGHAHRQTLEGHGDGQDGEDGPGDGSRWDSASPALGGRGAGLGSLMLTGHTGPRPAGAECGGHPCRRALPTSTWRELIRSCWWGQQHPPEASGDSDCSRRGEDSTFLPWNPTQDPGVAASPTLPQGAAPAPSPRNRKTQKAT